MLPLERSGDGFQNFAKDGDINRVILLTFQELVVTLKMESMLHTSLIQLMESCYSGEVVTTNGILLECRCSHN